MIEELGRQLPKIGYLFHYPDLSHPKEKFRLDIFISEKPTEQHFDVLKATFSIRTPQKTVANLKITHPWEYETSAIVCPGVVILEDRIGKKQEAFTFGGELRIDSQESQTICSLVSPAPIMDISGKNPLEGFFIEEMEILLAEEKAKHANDQAYQQQLCQTGPLKLYWACINELKDKLETLKGKNDSYRELLSYLHNQEHRLYAAGLMVIPPPTFETLFRS